MELLFINRLDLESVRPSVRIRPGEGYTTTEVDRDALLALYDALTYEEAQRESRESRLEAAWDIPTAIFIATRPLLPGGGVFLSAGFLVAGREDVIFRVTRLDAGSGDEEVCVAMTTPSGRVNRWLGVFAGGRLIGFRRE